MTKVKGGEEEIRPERTGMCLLIVNSNTSAWVTETVTAAAKQYTSPGVELRSATASFGAKVIASRTENAIAAHSTVDLVAEHAHDCDGVLIAVSYDSGLRAARELLGLPVLGLTEASLLAAMTVGTRIGLVIWGKGATSVYLEVVESYGMSSRICGARKVDVDIDGGPEATAALDDAILAAASDLIARDDAEVIVLVGAVLAGRSSCLQDCLPVPILDGARCGIPMLEAMVRVAAKAPARGSYALQSVRQTTGLRDHLSDRLLRLR